MAAANGTLARNRAVACDDDRRTVTSSEEAIEAELKRHKYEWYAQVEARNRAAELQREARQRDR